MSSIFSLPSAWRRDWQTASFRGARFHVEVASKEDARRIVTHQFPKKEVPYSEDMGRHAKTFSVRGHCIQYPYDADDLRQRDYRKPRDALIAALETEGPADLVLPFLPPLKVVCPRYRLTEESKAGGYCVFDMQFVEYGTPPLETATTARSELTAKANELLERSEITMTQPM